MGCIGGIIKFLVKFFLVILNVVFLGIGIFLIVVGSLTITVPDSVEKYANDFLDAVGADTNSNLDLGQFFDAFAISGIVAGCCLTLLSLITFAAICFKVKCMMGIYVFINVILTLGCIVACVFVAAPAVLPFDIVEVALKGTLEDYQLVTETTTGVGILWDLMQMEFKCCGVRFKNDTDVDLLDREYNGYKAALRFFNKPANLTVWGGSENGTMRIAPTCCAITNDDQYPNPLNSDMPRCYSTPYSSLDTNYMETGCYDAIYSDYYAWLVGVTAALAVFFGILTCLGICICTVGDDEEDTKKVEDVQMTAHPASHPQVIVVKS